MGGADGVSDDNDKVDGMGKWEGLDEVLNGEGSSKEAQPQGEVERSGGSGEAPVNVFSALG